MAVWVRTVSVFVDGDVLSAKEADLVVEEANYVLATTLHFGAEVEIRLPDEGSDHVWEKVE